MIPHSRLGYLLFVVCLLSANLVRLCQAQPQRSKPSIKAVTVVGDLGNYKATLQEIDLRHALDVIRTNDLLKEPVIQVAGLNFVRPEDSKTLKKLGVTRKSLPKVLVVEMTGSPAKPTKVLWSKPISNVRDDLDALMGLLKFDKIPSDIALTQFEERAMDAKRAEIAYKAEQAESGLKSAQKKAMDRIESSMNAAKNLPDVWRPGDSRYWNPHQGVGFENERNYLYRSAYSSYELVYPALNTGYRERRTFSNSDSWQVDLSKADSRLSEAESFLQDLEARTENLNEIGAKDAYARWQDVCSDIRGRIENARRDRSNRIDFVEDLLRRYRLPSFRQTGRVILDY